MTTSMDPRIYWSFGFVMFMLRKDHGSFLVIWLQDDWSTKLYEVHIITSKFRVFGRMKFSPRPSVNVFNVGSVQVQDINPNNALFFMGNPSKITIWIKFPPPKWLAFTVMIPVFSVAAEMYNDENFAYQTPMRLSFWKKYYTHRIPIFANSNWILYIFFLSEDLFECGLFPNHQHLFQLPKKYTNGCFQK